MLPGYSKNFNLEQIPVLKLNFIWWRKIELMKILARWHWPSRKSSELSSQSIMLQDSYRFLSPMQKRPPFLGAGLSQNRSDRRIPPPHVREHSLHLKYWTFWQEQFKLKLKSLLCPYPPLAINSGLFLNSWDTLASLAPFVFATRGSVGPGHVLQRQGLLIQDCTMLSCNNEKSLHEFCTLLKLPHRLCTRDVCMGAKKQQDKHNLRNGTILRQRLFTIFWQSLDWFPFSFWHSYLR